MTSDVQEHKTSITTPSDTEIRMERTFDAPPEVLWEMHTDPELLAQWLGPHDNPVTVESIDLRVGGSYRWTASDREGGEIAFFGEYRVIEPPRVLETTFQFSGVPGFVSVDRLELEELDDGRTRLVSISTHESKESRDGMLQSGMEKGVNDGYEKLDELLAARQS